LNTEQRSRSSYPPLELPAGEARHRSREAAAAARRRSCPPEKRAAPQQLPAARAARRRSTLFRSSYPPPEKRTAPQQLPAAGAPPPAPYPIRFRSGWIGLDWVRLGWVYD